MKDETPEQHFALQSWLAKVLVLASLAWISVTLLYCLYVGRWDGFQPLWDKVCPLLMFASGWALKPR